MVDAASALTVAKQLDESVGLITKVIGKLKSNPNAAALKLSEALDEIGKTYRAVDEGIAAYLGLAFAAQGVALSSQALLSVQGGQLLAEVERGRGHCHRIAAIYQTFLDKWFAQALDRTEYLSMKEVFGSLGEADFDLFGKLVDLARTLQVDADKVLDLLMTGREDEARAQVRAAYTGLKPLRVQLGQGMTRLYELRNEFIQMAGTV